MTARLERGPDGKLVLTKERKQKGMLSRRTLALGLSIALVAIAVTGIQTALAEGDKVQWNNGEEDHYEENNLNPYDDTDFPGDDLQNRTGVLE